jgi:hypothetical protein
MPEKHAVLSPSAAERWIECPASVRFSRQFRNESSVYAEEGTCAHELGEIKVSFEFGLIDRATFNRRRARWVKKWPEYAEVEETLVEMERHTDAYVELIRERAALYPHTQVMVEQRLNTGIPQSWGTSDTVLASPRHIEIVDFKYGAGVAVEAEGNPQLRLYALGALDTYGDLLGETEAVFMTVHQPRMDHVLTAEMTPDSLREWRSRILPIAQEALGADAHFGPSEAACRWCPASGRCEAQVQAAFPDDLLDEPVEELTEDRVAELLGRLPMLKDWLKAFEAQALTMAYSEGKTIPGWKVVRSGGQRRVKDEAKAQEVLEAEGLERDEFMTTKVKGIGDLEKLLGKDRFKELLEAPGIVAKSEGKESLAPESDSRPSITPNAEAAAAFGDVDG